MNPQQIDTLILDDDGYPTDEALKMLEEWDFLKHPFQDFVALLTDVWHWDFKRKTWKDGTIKLRLATGGWSGNEAVIAALRGNFIFWSLCWDKSKRGGAYWFTIEPAFQRMWKDEPATD